MNDISQKIKNAKGFSWKAGMLALILRDEEVLGMRLTDPVAASLNKNGSEGVLPDIDDPATLGALMSLAEIPFDINQILSSLEEKPDKAA